MNARQVEIAFIITLDYLSVVSMGWRPVKSTGSAETMQSPAAAR